MIDNNNNKNKYSITRYPKTGNHSLQAWSAADEYLLTEFDSLNLEKPTLAIFNDRFGFLTSHLHAFSPTVILDYKSQEKAIFQNLESNDLKFSEVNFITSLESLPAPLDVAFLKIPKSMDLFRMQLFQLSKSLNESSIVLASFMTKYFSPQMLSIANEFFEEVEQSKAWKKSRVLILKNKKQEKDIAILHSIEFQDFNYQQYFGVFSAKNIDYASQFFIQHLRLKESDQRVLDLASGNGVLSKAVQLQNPSSEIHLMDDSHLAIESSKLNMDAENVFFHFSDSMDIFEDDFFDFVISNPPFHFEHETNIEVAIQLFSEVKRCLKNGGRFELVASHHLNFKTHLIKIFHEVNIISENDKFIIYECF
ncbi:MAG: 16S rRNA G1207 methylase RsmC [Granulosicoccus sp.]|jgi:16S rRNA G1207 methylase RsmC